MMIKPHIDIINASFGYGRKCILSDISLKINPGEIHCVFGRNGSGKTTLLKSLNGLLTVLSGEVRIGNENLSSISNKDKAKLMSSVLTTRSDISNMLVEDYVVYGRYPFSDWLGNISDKDKEKCEESIKRCGVEGLRKTNLVELSDGEMQKVQITRALAQDSPILLLDEPASHLDLVNKAEIFNLLKQIGADKRTTILFTSHDIQFALQLADSFLTVNGGKVESITKDRFIKDGVYKEMLQSELLNFDPDKNSLTYNSTT